MLKHSFLPLFAAALLTSVSPIAAQSFPDGPGKDILEKKCSSCHSPSQVTTVGRSADEWQEVVVAMIDLGAEMNEEETKVLVEYLAKNWPAKKDEGAPAQGQPDQGQPGQGQPEKKGERAPAAPMAPVSSHKR